MNHLLLKDKASLYGGVLAFGLAFLLYNDGIFIIASAEQSIWAYVTVHIALIALLWLVFSYFIRKYHLYKVLALVGLLVVAVAAERYMDISENPITIPLLILFWLGVAYFVLPDFFKKYRVAILSIYALVILSYYFFFFNMDPNHTENHRTNFVNIMLIPIPVFAAFWLYEQWRWMRTLKADKTNAELALLKSQINPHFFFNTLNNLYGLTVEKSDQAPEMILKLSDIMRYTIYDGKADFVALQSEVAYMEDYIDLHMIRYQKQVDIRFQYELGKDIQVAPLLFIILLENAFKHGVESITENAYIHMQLTVEDEQVVFSIENNYEAKGVQHREGIGLSNLKQRLEHIYPHRHKLKIEKAESTCKAHLILDLSS